jgi:hypothetical protein
MDTNEARGILLAESAKYRAKNYGDLVALLRHQDTYEIIGPSETVYQLELQAFWDDKATGVLRVRTAIDDRGIRAYVPMIEDFLVTSDGHFVGE